jgi:hypothetical protein
MRSSCPGEAGDQQGRDRRVLQACRRPALWPFTLTVNWNGFHVVGDIAIATSVFEGDVTRNGKADPFPRQGLLVWKKQICTWNMFRYMFDEIPAKKITESLPISAFTLFSLNSVKGARSPQALRSQLLVAVASREGGSTINFSGHSPAKP